MPVPYRVWRHDVCLCVAKRALNHLLQDWSQLPTAAPDYRSEHSGFTPCAVIRLIDGQLPNRYAVYPHPPDFASQQAGVTLLAVTFAVFVELLVVFLCVPIARYFTRHLAHIYQTLYVTDSDDADARTRIRILKPRNKPKNFVPRAMPTPKPAAAAPADSPSIAAAVTVVTAASPPPRDEKQEPATHQSLPLPISADVIVVTSPPASALNDEKSAPAAQPPQPPPEPSKSGIVIELATATPLVATSVVSSNFVDAQRQSSGFRSLDRPVLASTFSFLALYDLLAATIVSRHWNEAAAAADYIWTIHFHRHITPQFKWFPAPGNLMRGEHEPSSGERTIRQTAITARVSSLATFIETARDIIGSKSTTAARRTQSELELEIVKPAIDVIEAYWTKQLARIEAEDGDAPIVRPRDESDDQPPQPPQPPEPLPELALATIKTNHFGFTLIHRLIRESNRLLQRPGREAFENTRVIVEGSFFFRYAEVLFFGFNGAVILIALVATAKGQTLLWSCLNWCWAVIMNGRFLAIPSQIGWPTAILVGMVAVSLSALELYGVAIGTALASAIWDFLLFAVGILPTYHSFINGRLTKLVLDELNLQLAASVAAADSVFARWWTGFLAWPKAVAAFHTYGIGAAVLYQCVLLMSVLASGAALPVMLEWNQPQLYVNVAVSILLMYFRSSVWAFATPACSVWFSADDSAYRNWCTFAMFDINPLSWLKPLFTRILPAFLGLCWEWTLAFAAGIPLIATLASWAWLAEIDMKTCLLKYNRVPADPSATRNRSFFGYLASGEWWDTWRLPTLHARRRHMRLKVGAVLAINLFTLAWHSNVIAALFGGRPGASLWANFNVYLGRWMWCTAMIPFGAQFQKEVERIDEDESAAVAAAWPIPPLTGQRSRVSKWTLAVGRVLSTHLRFWLFTAVLFAVVNVCWIHRHLPVGYEWLSPLVIHRFVPSWVQRAVFHAWMIASANVYFHAPPKAVVARRRTAPDAEVPVTSQTADENSDAANGAVANGNTANDTTANGGAVNGNGVTIVPARALGLDFS